MMRLNKLFRNIYKQKLHSGIIIISLALGIACINLIALFITRELNTDSFHKHKDQIYALQCDDPWNVGGQMYYCRFGSAEYMKSNFPQVEDFCRLDHARANKITINNDDFFDMPIIMAASDNFFEFFSYPLLTNNPKSALEAGNNIVISEKLAKKYFGITDPVGKTITVTQRDKLEDMVVTGVFRKSDENSQLKFDMVRAIKETDSRCYVRLKPNANKEQVENIFKINKEKIPIIYDRTPGSYYLKSLTNTYFDSTREFAIEKSRDKTDLWITFIIGALIMIIACFNFLGLLNNKLLEKSKDITIERINGGSKFHFTQKFMIENLVLILVSFVISLFILLWITPFFNNLTSTNITLGYIFKTQPILIQAGILVLIYTITFLFVLFRISKNIDTDVLKSSANKKGKLIQLPVFNVFQLTGTIVLIICSMVILKQAKYISNKPIGLDKDVIEVKIPVKYGKLTSAFKEELLKYTAVNEVSIASASPVLEHFLILLHYNENGKEKQYTPSGFGGDENYITSLGIELLDGENFSGNPQADRNKCLINQSLAKMFPDQNLIGKGLPGSEDLIITGIVKDFHYSSLKSVIEPAFIGYYNKGRNLMVKPQEGKTVEAQNAILSVWGQIISDFPVNTETIGARYEWMHRENKNYIQLISACCMISIFLSMIGLFAISYQNSRYRTKEIGIRKVNGARASEVMTMLNYHFSKWVVFAFIISTPIAWYVMHKWLENFAYKTELNWWIFVLAGIITLGIALLTVSWQSWLAARRNPVKALRYE